jgi:pimeloyl-ACP methyl ester carboxylesterase
MGYTGAFEKFKKYDLFVDRHIDLEESFLKIRTLNFQSNKLMDFKPPYHPSIIPTSSNEEAALADKEEINSNFTYPIFLPYGEKKYNRVIVLLHGLNERSWQKYMTWAAELAQSTQSAVILFPISYHMNRAPKQWGDPREMLPLLRDSKSQCEGLKNSSFANVALSERLKYEPLRFFSSGYQSADDLTMLIRLLNQGKIPFVRETPQIDFFAYSIGAFLSQILFIANPNGVISNSRLFMFGGGAFFNSMNGVSKLIMDEQAFTKIFRYYNDDFEKEAQKDTILGKFLQENSLAMAFRSMLNIDRLKDFRNDMLAMLKDQIYAIAPLKDSVIPPTGISSFFRSISSKNIEMVDFAYPYSHEQPFPINGKPALSAAVDGGFNHVFKRAANFLA